MSAQGRRDTDSGDTVVVVPANTPHGYAMSVTVGVLLTIIGVLVYFHFKPQQVPTGMHVIATPAPEVAKVATEFIDFAPIKVFKPEAKKRLNLPAQVQADTRAHVVASTKTANDERQHTVTTLIDDKTGEATTYDRVDPLPWLAVNTKSQVGAFYGLKNGEAAFRIQAQQELLQIKALHLGVTASADVTRGGVDTFLGVGAWARW